MVDEIDLANDLIDNEVSRALRRIQQNSKHYAGMGPKECMECGEMIPSARRQLGFRLCVSCASETERRKSLYAD